MQNNQRGFSTDPMLCQEKLAGSARCWKLAIASRDRLAAGAGGLIVAGATLVAIAGCTSAGYKKGDVAAVSLQRAATEVQAETKDIDQTMAALQDLVQQPSGDLRPAFKRFSIDLDRLVARAQKTERTGQQVREKNNAYFQAWDQQLQAIDYQHIRELGQARKAQVTNDIAAINRRYAESQAAVQPLISYLQDIRKALSADLTPGGRASMKAVVQNANDNVVKVQKALDALIAQLTNSGARLASVARAAE